MSVQEFDMRLGKIKEATASATNTIVALEDAEIKTPMLKTTAASCLAEAIRQFNIVYRCDSLTEEQKINSSLLYSQGALKALTDRYAAIAKKTK